MLQERRKDRLFIARMGDARLEMEGRKVIEDATRDGGGLAISPPPSPHSGV